MGNIVIVHRSIKLTVVNSEYITKTKDNNNSDILGSRTACKT